MKKKLLSIVIGTIIGILFILIWLHYVDIQSISAYLSDIRIEFVIIALLFYLSAYFIRSLRWRLLLLKIVRIPVMRNFLILMAGNFTNYLIPIRAGEFMKCYFIKKIYGKRISHTLPSVFVDKLFDMLGIIFVLVLVPVMSVTLPTMLFILIIVILIILITGCAILFMAAYAGDKVNSILKRLFFFIPAKYEIKLDEIITLFVEGLAVFKDHKQLIFPVIMLSFIAIFFDSFFFYSLFMAFGFGINYFYILLGYTLIYLSYILPHPPAQLGSNELIMILIFTTGFGMYGGAAGSIMLFSHLMTGLIIITVGIFAYFHTGVKLITIFNKGDNLYE